MQNVLIALGLTMFAGLATGIGSVIPKVSDFQKKRVL